MSDDKKSTQADAELNDLLDSALADFSDKPAKSSSARDGSSAAAAAAATTEAEQKSVSEKSVEELTDETWTQDFIKQAADQFEKNLQNLMQDGGDSEFGASLQKMAQTVASAIESNTPRADGEGPDFQAAISQALKDLSVTSENLQNATPDITEGDLSSIFGQASLDEGSEDFAGFMQGMMQSILSKEMLYPWTKDIVDQYPEWLEKNKSTLPEADLVKYNKQLELMRKVCAEWEKQKDDDSEDVKKQRFTTIFALMEEIEVYGSPPKELTSDRMFETDAEGNPILPAFPGGLEKNCTVM